MRKSQFTDDQIAFALKQAELGITVVKVCRKMGISNATFYKWRAKYAGVGPSELRARNRLVRHRCRSNAQLTPSVHQPGPPDWSSRVRLKLTLISSACD